MAGEESDDDYHNENQETFLYFDDGVRRIDYVLAYTTEHIEGTKRSERAEVYFKNYLEFLKNQCGLEFEKVGNTSAKCSDEADEDENAKGKVSYIKIHAPMEVLYRSAEDLKMKMKTKLYDVDIKEWYQGNRLMNFLDDIDPFKLRHPLTRHTKDYFVAPFLRERLDEFINHNKPQIFFTPAERGRLVYYILQQAKFGNEDTEIGINNLIHKGVFLDAYPLHDGPTLRSNNKKAENERQRLQKDWASVACIFRHQPIDAIKEYFGEKIALYFSFLGFYTAFLIPAAIVGIACFIYGVVSGVDAPTVIESCSDPLAPGRKGPGTGHLFYMCPLCDKRCPYFKLKDNCVYAEVTRYFDNEATLFLSLFMSIWATLFLQFWKRRDKSLAHEWHSIGFERTEEQVRPEYIATNVKLKQNPITLKYEPHMSKAVKTRRMLGTFGVVSFFVVLVIGAVVGVVVFRAVFSVALLASDNELVRQRTKVIVSIVAGCLNLIAINILKRLYNRIAVVLTDFECPRTRTEYEDSFTIKMFFFQFFNTYSSIVYVAFFKSENITGTPGRYKRFSDMKFRMDGCSAQGCFLELTIQLIIIMVGQQVLNNILEIVVPTLLKWKKDRAERKKINDQQVEGGEGDGRVLQPPQWEDDFGCQQQTKFTLFWEYLEMVLQYGFVTMFVAGFPLAPFFALLNNIVEIRVDAYNYVHNQRRPVAQRAEDVGAWYNILVVLTCVSVLMNAFVLAFTSQLIPKLVYKHTASPNGTMHGYVDWSLSYFNVNDFDEQSRPSNETGRPEQDQCRYPGFRDSAYPYDQNMKYWMVLAVRLAFVLCFVIFVLSVSWLITYLINDLPKSLELTIKREKFLATEADKNHKVKVEKRKTAKSGGSGGSGFGATTYVAVAASDDDGLIVHGSGVATGADHPLA